MTVLDFRVTFHGPVRVGTGMAKAGAHQAAWTAPGPDGRTLLAPGSTVKGLMRDAAAELFPTTVVDEVFGSRRIQCPWSWGGVSVPTEAVRHRLRTRIQLTEEGVVARDMLAVAEESTVTGPGSFTIRRLQFVTLTPDAVERHTAVLHVCAGLVKGLGGARRRGLGWVGILPVHPADPDGTAALAKAVPFVARLSGDPR